MVFWPYRFQVVWGSFDVLLSQNGLYSKTTGCTKKLEIRDCSNTYMGYIWPCRVQCHIGVIRGTCLKIPCNYKTAGRGAKRGEIWDPRTPVTNLWGSIDLVVFNFILGSFGALKKVCNSATVGRRANQIETWGLERLITHIWCIFDLVVSKVILESFGALVSKYPVTIKWLVVEWKGRVKFETYGL